MSEELHNIARDLLEKGAVQVVIGYGTVKADPTKTRPVLVTDPRDVGELVWNPRCVNNLAVYLTKSKEDVQALGKPAIVAKGCDVRAIIALIQEHQLSRDDVVIIGMACEGVVSDGAEWKGELTEENKDLKCRFCDVRTPRTYDFLVGGEIPPLGREDGWEDVRELEALSASERWDFWQAQFEQCIRCYACRQACPFCYCARCVADKTIPRWIESSQHPRANLAWNIIRAMHLAGRCVGCGECERVCPAGIPLGLLNRQLAREVEREYGYRPGYDSEVSPPIGTYREEDDETFIL